MSETTTSARRYNLTDLLHIVNEIGTSTAQAQLTSTDIQTLKQHTALCAILKQQEQDVEQATLLLITRPRPAANLANQAISPPVSKFARMMWGRGSGSGQDMVEVRDFAEAGGDEDGDDKQRRFETERDRQLYDRPREWRRRRRGEWADTGPRSS